ncbi:MAG: class I SAM-dependent methyltransferase [Phycisphaerales bacterium]
MSCPICQAETVGYLERRAFGEMWRLDRCRECGHAFVVNRPTPERLEQIYSQGEHRSNQVVTVEALEAKRGCRDLATCIVDLTPLREGALDVGSGEGGFSYHLAQQGFSPITMIDLDPGSNAATDVVTGSTFERVSFENFTGQGPFAAIVMSQVLEHALDPMLWLRKAAGLLRERGALAIAVPNFGGVYRLLGYRDPMLMPPIHLNHFTARSLRLAIEAAGMDVLRMDSTSQVRVSASERALSQPRVLAGRMWNKLAGMLDHSTRGISLRAFATKKSAG